MITYQEERMFVFVSGKEKDDRAEILGVGKEERMQIQEQITMYEKLSILADTSGTASLDGCRRERRRKSGSCIPEGNRACYGAGGSNLDFVEGIFSKYFYQRKRK